MSLSACLISQSKKSRTHACTVHLIHFSTSCQPAAELDQVASLERAAHITLFLVQELQSATETVSALTMAGGSSADDAAGGGGAGTNGSSMLPTMRQLEPDSEKAQFVLKLAPRIRRLESDTTNSLGKCMEGILRQLQRLHEESTDENDHDDSAVETGDDKRSWRASLSRQRENLLFQLGHCMRGLVLLGRGDQVESIFARIAIMPLIRSKVSMGRLDEGGSRGECAGLASLLDEMAKSIHDAFGPVLRLAETMFGKSDRSNPRQASMDVDLVTAGVWVPIATALMADAGIKMAIFSPGIASILQANYIALDRFLAQLAVRLLEENSAAAEAGIPAMQPVSTVDLYFRPPISDERIQEAQDRIYMHAKTSEFSKRWNLPIYYQLRFGECCSRLNKAVDQTKREGWIAEVFTGPSELSESIKHDVGFELSLFLELYDILVSMWRPDVILRPLSNRFLRGAVQLIGSVISFVGDGMEGRIKFGEDWKENINKGTSENGNETPETPGAPQPPSFPTRSTYCWGDSEQDVAAVAWELTILDSAVMHDYVDTVCKALARDGEASESEDMEVRKLVSDALKDTSDQMHPLIDKAWNEYVVNILTSKCSAPLAAVKGVAATYRMTNRPPPTQASPFVGTILRPLKEFSKEFENRTPERVGSRWKHQVVVTISDRYAGAVEELIATVQRTEQALKGRRARQTASGGMRDGEKVKLQLYLDYEAFLESVRDAGVDPGTVIGLSKLRDLTAEGLSLMKQTSGNENGS